MPRETLVEFIQDIATLEGEFLVYDDGYRARRYTYADVARAARAFAARLAAAGVDKGENVVFWGENRPEWIAGLWGCMAAGVVAVPIDYRSSSAFVEKVRRLVHARVILVGDDIPDIAPTDFAGAAVWRFRDFDWRIDAPMPRVAISRDDIIEIIFTSGATAEPKGVVIRHRNVLANIVPVEREIAKYRRYARPFHPLRFLNLLPLSHMFGQSMAAHIPPMVGGTVIFTRSLSPHDLIRLMRSRRVSVLVCVPKILDVLREHVAHTLPESTVAPAAGSSIPGRWWTYRRVHSTFGLKFWAFVVGAAPLPPDLEEFWRRMGFAVIQGYGLTETAPIVTLNHPFKARKEGSVGTPIAGVDVKIADDGEILVRGENVTSGYYAEPSTGQADAAARRAVDDAGWLHTGDIGELDAEGRLFIKGRKKEMIVTPEGLNVFPEDIERTLNDLPGVRESAVVGVAQAGEERVHAVLVLEPGAGIDDVLRQANARLQDHQRIRSASIWTAGDLPRTDGTRKLKRAGIREWVLSGVPPPETEAADGIEGLLARFARGRQISGSTTLEDLGLSSLERVELMVALEDRFQTRVDEGRFAEVASVDDLKRLVEEGVPERSEQALRFPTWNRAWPVRLVRRLSLATWILPLGRLFAPARLEGLDHLRNCTGPVIFAANHQSHMDVPVILAAMPGRWRARVAPAMLKEFFAAHFHPEGHTWRQRFTNSLNYYLACFYFNGFPIPQREGGTRHTLHYMGELVSDGWSILIFPEGERAPSGHIKMFRGGVGMIASRLDVPVVPVRLDGVDRVLHRSRRMARRGRVRVAFGAPMHLHGDDYADLAKKVEEQVRALAPNATIR